VLKRPERLIRVPGRAPRSAVSPRRDGAFACSAAVAKRGARAI